MLFIVLENLLCPNEPPSCYLRLRVEHQRGHFHSEFSVVKATTMEVRFVFFFCMFGIVLSISSYRKMVKLAKRLEVMSTILENTYQLPSTGDDNSLCYESDDSLKSIARYYTNENIPDRSSQDFYFHVNRNALQLHTSMLKHLNDTNSLIESTPVDSSNIREQHTYFETKAYNRKTLLQLAARLVKKKSFFSSKVLVSRPNIDTDLKALSEVKLLESFATKAFVAVFSFFSTKLNMESTFDQIAKHLIRERKKISCSVESFNWDICEMYSSSVEKQTVDLVVILYLNQVPESMVKSIDHNASVAAPFIQLFRFATLLAKEVKRTYGEAEKVAKEGILQDLLQFDSKSIPENHLVLHVNTEGLKRYGALLYIQKLYQQSLSFKLVPKQVVSSKEVSQTQIESAFEEKPVTIDQEFLGSFGPGQIQMIAIVFKFPIDLKVLIGEEHLGFFEHYIIKRVVQSLWKVSMSKKIQGQPYECTLWNVDSDPTTLIVQAIWSSDANDAQMLEMLQYSRYMQSIAMESTNTFLLKSNAFDILKYIDNEKPRKTD